MDNEAPVQMEWSEVHDPKGEIDFHMEWTLVSSMYTPEEVQEMIDERGVLDMVHTVNEHFKLTTGRTALLLAHVGDRKAVVQA